MPAKAIDKTSEIIKSGYDIEVIAKSMAGMEDALNQIKGRVDLYDIDDETLETIDKKDLRKQRSDMNAALKLYDEQRKTLKRELARPYDAATETGKKLVDQLKAESERYKKRIDEIDAQEKADRADKLQATYMAAYAPEFTGAISFDRLLEPQWLNASTSYQKAEDAMLDKANGIAVDFDNLFSSSLKCPEQTRAHFLQTLDLGDALRFDREQWEAQEQARKLAELKTPPEPAPGLDNLQPVIDDEPVLYQDGNVKVTAVYPDEEPEKVYKLITTASKQQLIAAFKAFAIHGKIMEVI